ncbi:MAG TPA: aldo/keto reductase [Nitrospirota bacterium]|nr:aldo/keto reductase [Nitrospirota bacterium]
MSCRYLCYTFAMTIPKRRLGKTGVDVTILGLGGEGVLRTYGREREADALINRALDLGINYCESARVYSGSESYYGKALRERRKDVFLTSKSHARDKRGALGHLHETLRNMRTDHLDLWQVHDVRTEDDVEAIFGAGGAIEAFIEAKEKGLTRFIGVTGHHDPSILRTCIERFDFDTVLLPVNPAEPRYRSFLEEVVPFARSKKMGIVGMKVYLRGFVSRLPGYTGMGPFLRFALSQPVTNVVIGCDDAVQLEKNAGFARSFSPMKEVEKDELIRSISPYARELMFYKP